MRARVEQMRDKLGKRIDDGIKETVIVLNLLGIQTRQSCEGHLESGTGAPWIDLEEPGLEEQEQQARDAMKAAQEQAKQEQLSREVIHLFEKAHHMRMAVKQRHLAGRRKMIQYLARFYEDRVVPYDRRLTIQSQATGRSRLESQGADFLETAPFDVKAQKLQEYQEEMQAFTAFLKEQFFAGEQR